MSCICLSLMPCASGKQASGFPSSGVVVKTSTWMKSNPLRAACARAGSAPMTAAPVIPARKPLRCMAYPPRMTVSLFPIGRLRNRNGHLSLARRTAFGDPAAMNDPGSVHKPHRPHRATPERVFAFSDGVFAVLITVLVLELRPPAAPTFKALLALWPTWLSYALSYLFIAIVWINHHYLMRYANEATPRLLWFNFAHLFSMSLLPLSTAWMAVSRLAPQPVAFYAAVFFLVNATYIALIWELIDQTPVDQVPPSVR